MIGFLTGQPQALGESVIIMTGGVGYVVQLGPKTLPRVMAKSEVSLYIHAHVKEDAFDLYGFESVPEYQVFQELIKVSGVGPKTAQAIVDQQPGAVIEAVQQAQTNFFKAIPRVGKKVAQKIIIELGSKSDILNELQLGPKSPRETEFAEALTSLGVNPQTIEQLSREIDLEQLPIETAISLALKHIGTTRT